MAFIDLKQKILDDQFNAITEVLQLKVEEIRERISAPYPPPSYPGEPPHLRTGNLRDSISWNAMKMDNGVDAGIIATAPYAAYLQDGTPKMAPRPFLPDEEEGEKMISQIKQIIEG